MVKKVNRKKFFLSITSFFLALGLILSAVQDSRRIEDSNNVGCISENGDVKGANQITSDCYVPSWCSSNNACHSPASGGCIYRPTDGCNLDTHYECQGDGGYWYCCGRGFCDPFGCEPCSGAYSSTDTGCSITQAHCKLCDCKGQCGTRSGDCYPKKFSIKYYAGTGGTITGSTSQNVCYGSSGTQVTAVPNSGYAFSQWSDGGTSASRSDVATDEAQTFTASFVTNNPPTAPTSLLTNGQTNPTDLVGPTPYFSAIFNDPDTGDTGVHYRIQVNTNSSFSGTTMWDSGKTAMTSTAIGARSPDITYNGTNLPQDGTLFYWRIKFWDNGGLEGAWSASAQFTMKYIIPAASGLQTNGLTNPTGVTTPYPKFSAIYNNYTGKGNATHVQLKVYLGSISPGNEVWNFSDAIPNIAPGNRSADITYGGDPLIQNGATYIWRIRFWDGVAWDSTWSNAQFTMKSGGNPTAPTNLLTNGKTNPTGVTTPQPYFSAIFNDPDTGDTGTHYRIQVNTNSSFSGTTMWDSSKTAMSPTAIGSRSPNITYNGSTLQAGQTYYWRIKFWDNGGLEGVWSSTAQFTMNTPPTAPTAPLTNGMTNPTDVASTPYFSAIFNDADSTDTGVYYQIQVNTNSSFSGTTMWDSGKTAMTATNPSSRSPNINYAGNTLSYNGTTYYWRIRFWDNHGVVSPYSSTAQFTTVISGAAPTSLLTNGQTNPTNVVPSPAPYFSAIFNHSNPSRRAVHYQIIMTVSGMQVWNSGKTSMTSTAPGSRCPNITYNGSHTLDHNGNVYKWTIVFWDDLGVQTATSAEAQFTMNRRPTPPTGLLTEGQTNPSGVTDTTPEFSAIYNNPTGTPAVYYQIQVNEKANFTGTMKWDSEKTSMDSLSNGSRSPDIEYAGSTLTQNGQTYFWKIRFWDNLGGDGEWSAVNYFTMHNNAYTFTISSEGTQVNPVTMDRIEGGDELYMGGVFSFTVYNINPAFSQPGITSITLQRTWTSGSGDIDKAILLSTTTASGQTCPTTLPSSTSYFGDASDPYGSGSSVTINGSLGVAPDQQGCIYVIYSFTSKSVSEGSVLDFQVTNFTANFTGTKFGLPANITGTTTFIPTPKPPTFTNITNNGPKDPGGTITFSTTSSDPDGDNVKLVVCKTQGVTGTACDGGDDDTYCTSSFVGSNPSCSWDIPSVYPDGSYYAYPYIFDSTNLPADSIRQGAAHAFTVNNVAPLPISISINGGDDITLVTGSTKSVTLNVSVKDYNGCENNEIVTTKAYMYRSGITGGYSSCDTSDENNANNCYPEIPCTFVNCTTTQSTTPNTANYTCTTSLQYYADPTDPYSPFSEESWVATAKATDNGFGSAGTNPLTGTWGITDGVDVNSLLAFNVTQELNYGTRLAGELISPLPKTITISSAGNIALNHSVSGDDMCEDYPTCEGSKILVKQQRYGLSASTQWFDGVELSATPTNVFTNLPKQTTSTPTSVNIWWGILAPTGTAPKQYTGKNTITSSVAY